MTLPSRWALALSAAACATTDGAPATTPAQTAADSADPCVDYTWATVGAPVILTWCTPCHSADLPAGQRQRAPLGVDFDEEADVLAAADRVLARATGAGPTMPPMSGPTDEERALLAAWIACARP